MLLKKNSQKGLLIGNDNEQKCIFAAENVSWLDKADKKVNELIGQVKSSCDIVLVWKRKLFQSRVRTFLT